MEKVKVFLGGTCASSTWRKELIPQLGDHIEYFDPQLPPGAWNPEAQEVEIYHRKTDDICLYVITPEAEGFTSFIEAVDDSNKRPERTVLCVIPEVNGKKWEGHFLKCVLVAIRMVADNGAYIASSLEEVAAYLNGLKKEETSVKTK